MAGYWTNRACKLALNILFRGATAPTSFKLALVKSTATISEDTNVWSDVSGQEIAAGNGYTAGGQTISRNSTDFDTLTEDDTLNRAVVLLKDISWTASGGPIPASGGGARYAVLYDSGGTNEVWAYFDLGSDRTISTGNTSTIIDATIGLKKP